jgi:hypothetical protein
LELGIHSRGSRSASTDAGAAAKEGFVVREGREFDAGFLGARMVELNTLPYPSVLDKLERFFTTSVLVVFEKLLADLVVLSVEIEAGIADPGARNAIMLANVRPGLRKLRTRMIMARLFVRFSRPMIR